MSLIRSERYVIGCVIGCASVFVLLAMLVFRLDSVNSLDRVISTWLLTLRNPLLDAIMVMITMMADSRVLTLFAVALVLILLGLRVWKLAVFCSVTMLAYVFLVPLLKQWLQRARPVPLSIGADSFSFPSGHAALSTVVLGIAVVLVASGLGRVARIRLVICLAVLLFAIALSRVYLQIHWATDVLAGVVLGGMSLMALILVLERSGTSLPGQFLAITLSAAYLVIYLVYLVSAFSLVSSFYFAA